MGIHGEYQWLETDHRLSEFESLCPEAIVGKYIAITAVDSGGFQPSPEDEGNGWREAGGIAYSPVVEAVAFLPKNCCCRECYGFDEWLVFRDHPGSLGAISDENVFEANVGPGQIFRFINFGGFRLSSEVMKPVSDLFWAQMDWVHPESYIGDGQECLIFASRNSTLFREVEATLRDSPPK